MIVPDDLLPKEGAEYFSVLERARFQAAPLADQLIEDPPTLYGLVRRALQQTAGPLEDQRYLYESEGLSCNLFELDPPNYLYIRTPASGYLALLPLREAPENTYVTLLPASTFSITRIGFRRRRQNRHADPEYDLVPVVSVLLRVPVNYATLLIARNWFPNPSTEYAVLDCYMGPPVPHSAQVIPHEMAKACGLEPKATMTAKQFAQELKDTGLADHIWLRACKPPLSPPSSGALDRLPKEQQPSA